MAFFASLFRPLAYLSLPVILLRSIAASSPRGRYYIRQGVYVGSLVTAAACGVIFAAGMSVIGSRYDVNYMVACVFYNLAGTALDLDVKVEGEEYLDMQPAVLMSNHQSMLDIFVVGRLMPKQTSIMAKKSLKFTPLGPFMAMSGAIFVDRGNNARAVQSLIAAGELMRSLKISLWMFPEGTRTNSETPNMLPLKKGGFHLAIQAGIPIIPIVTENYWKLYHKDVFNKGTIKVRVLPPVSTTGLTTADIPELANRVRDQMLETLREISAVPLSSGKIENSEEKMGTLSFQPNTPRSLTEDFPRTSSHVSDHVLDTSASNTSLASSFSASTVSKSGASENGAETEEDEGMILVGRPT